MENNDYYWECYEVNEEEYWSELSNELCDESGSYNLLLCRDYKSWLFNSILLLIIFSYSTISSFENYSSNFLVSSLNF